MRSARFCCFIAIVASAAGNPVGDSRAQAYPVKPIRVIDAYPPGGGTDIVARAISAKFAESLGQPWVVDNRPGAQGIIGTEIASKAAPDGYTLLMYTTRASTGPCRTVSPDRSLRLRRLPRSRWC